TRSLPRRSCGTTRRLRRRSTRRSRTNAKPTVASSSVRPHAVNQPIGRSLTTARSVAVRSIPSPRRRVVHVANAWQTALTTSVGLTTATSPAEGPGVVTRSTRYTDAVAAFELWRLEQRAKPADLFTEPPPPPDAWKTEALTAVQTVAYRRAEL